jgi:hypothetical protein
LPIISTQPIRVRIVLPHPSHFILLIQLTRFLVLVAVNVMTTTTSHSVYMTELHHKGSYSSDQSAKTRQVGSDHMTLPSDARYVTYGDYKVAFCVKYYKSFHGYSNKAFNCLIQHSATLSQGIYCHNLAQPLATTSCARPF